MKRKKLSVLGMAALLVCTTAMFVSCGSSSSSSSSSKSSSSSSSSSSSVLSDSSDSSVSTSGNLSDSENASPSATDNTATDNTATDNTATDNTATDSTGDDKTETKVNFTAVATTKDSIEKEDETIVELPYIYINYVYDQNSEVEGAGSWGKTLATADIPWANFVTLKDGETTLSVGENGVQVEADSDVLNGEVTFTFTYGEQSVDITYMVYYGIANEGQFYKMADDLTANYILTQDMNFELVVPDMMDTFKGTLNGNFKKISNINIYSESWWCGIFKHNQGTIKNLVITSGKAYGTSGVGVIAGENAGKIDNCYVNVTTYSNYNNEGVLETKDGYVTGEGSYIGGIVGANKAGGRVKGCVFIGKVTGEGSYIGGIAGSSEAGWMGYNIYVTDAEGAALFGNDGEATRTNNYILTTEQAADITPENYVEKLAEKIAAQTAAKEEA